MIKLFFLEAEYIKNIYDDTLLYKNEVENIVGSINRNKPVFVADDATIDKEYIRHLLEDMIGKFVINKVKDESLKIKIMEVKMGEERIPYAYMKGSNLISNFIDKPLSEID